MLYGYETLTLIPEAGQSLTVGVTSQDLYTRTDEVSVRGDGTEALDGRTHALEALVVDAAALATIERWERSGVQVRAFALGLEASLVWDEPCRVRVVPEGQQKAGRHRAKVRLFTALREARVIGPVVNLLQGAFLPGGFDPVTRSVTHTLDYETVVYESIVSCMGDITASVSVVYPEATTETGTLEIAALSSPTVGLASSTCDLTTQNRACTLALPSGTRFVRWRLTISSEYPVTISPSEPCLRVATPIMTTPITQPVAY